MVAFLTWAEAFRAFKALRGFEVYELADVPLEIEIAMRHPSMSVPPDSPYPKIVIRQIRFNTYKSVIERFLCNMNLAPHQVYMCRKGEYWEGKKTSCLVTYRTWPEAFRAFNDIEGLEVMELSDVPLETEIATAGASREPTQQAPIRA